MWARLPPLRSRKTRWGAAGAPQKRPGSPVQISAPGRHWTADKSYKIATKAESARARGRLSRVPAPWTGCLGRAAPRNSCAPRFKSQLCHPRHLEPEPAAWLAKAPSCTGVRSAGQEPRAAHLRCPARHAGPFLQRAGTPRVGVHPRVLPTEGLGGWLHCLTLSFLPVRGNKCPQVIITSPLAHVKTGSARSQMTFLVRIEPQFHSR